MSEVRFLSANSNLTITQSGRDIWFTAATQAGGGSNPTLVPLTFGNGLSVVTANSGTGVYNPYTGQTVHVNNNTANFDGIVRKGTDAAVAAIPKKVWRTDPNDNPNWGETVVLEGGTNIEIEFVGTLANGIKKYRINYVPY